MRWLGGENDREAWFKFGFKEGQLLECAVRDDAGHTQGTIVVKVLEKRATGPAGHFVDCQYLCASDSHYRWWATEGPGRSLRKKATYHFCDGNSHECQEKLGRQKLIYVETFRLLTDEVNQSKSPGWLFTRPCFAIMGPHLKDLTKEETPGEGDGLPWVDQEEKDSSDGSDSSEDEGREDMRKQISRLKRELAAAEENYQKKGDQRKRPASGDKKKKKKKDKKRRHENVETRKRRPRKRKSEMILDLAQLEGRGRLIAVGRGVAVARGGVQVQLTPQRRRGCLEVASPAARTPAHQDARVTGDLLGLLRRSALMTEGAKTLRMKDQFFGRPPPRERRRTS